MSQSLFIILPALLAGLLVLASHVPLGREVLARGIIFLDLAVAQLAGLGVIAAYSFGYGEQFWLVQLFAVGSALLGAALLFQTEKRLPEIQEAIIGSSFVLAATGGMILLAREPHGNQHMADLLNGQILWVEYNNLIPLALVALLVLLVSRGNWRDRPRLRFYTVFAIAITTSVQVVGVYLVFASLILPAIAVVRMTRYALHAAYGIGALGYLLGLSLSVLFDLPAGPAIVWMLALTVIAWLTMRRLPKIS